MRQTVARKGLFELGDIVATPEALAALANLSKTPLEFLARHARGDWGEMTPADRRANETALQDGSRIFSSYQVGALKIWVITEAKDDNDRRRSTCVLLPEDY